MNSFKVTYQDGTSYATSANGTLKEFTDYLMQDGGVVVDENPVTGKETRRQIVKVEQLTDRDEIHDHQLKRPEREFYDIYTDKDGSKVYYLRDMNLLHKYEALYGRMFGVWSYTNHEADRTC